MFCGVSFTLNFRSNFVLKTDPQTHGPTDKAAPISSSPELKNFALKVKRVISLPPSLPKDSWHEEHVRGHCNYTQNSGFTIVYDMKMYFWG